MIDRDQLREALDADTTRSGSSYIGEEYPEVWPIVEAARLVADPDTLTISKVDGEWPVEALDALHEQQWATDRPDSCECSAALDALLDGQPK